MQNTIKALVLAFSFFSRLPMPNVKFDNKAASGAVLFLPVVGIAVGAIDALMMVLGHIYKAPKTCIAILYLIIPILVTGGIHLDGMIDTTDARNSYASVEKRHEILKDPHVGAFGIIRLLLYVLTALAVLFYLFERNSGMPVERFTAIFAAPFVLSRALLAVIVFWFKAYEADDNQKGMLAMLKEGQKPWMRYVALLEAVVATGVVFLIMPVQKSVAVMVLETALLIYFKYFSYKEFDGVSGDLCGWFLCMSELFFGIGVII